MAVKLIARRHETPAPGVRETRSTTRLPDDLLAEQIRRLALFAAVIGALWMYGLSMDAFILKFVMPAAAGNPVAMGVEVAGILISALMFVYVRYAPQPADVKRTIGLAYMILNAVGVALLNTWATTPVYGQGPTVSWIAVLILVFSMISPATPRRMLAASLVAASMDPLGVWFADLRGVPAPSVVITFLHFLPNYICALVAIVPSQILQRLGRRLREAQELGSYRLVELLGHGGMGEVWRAEHRLLARNAAVKLVRPEVLGAGDTADAKVILRRFEREAQATASLSSPHTIHVFDYGMTDEGTFYYVMELLSGRDLESLVRDFGPLPADRAIFLLRQVCHSLADAHARGLVHRDIKPANIYVCRMGLEYDFVKVLDFGLVKVHDRPSTQTLLTVNQHTTGTPAYMAPELILGESDVDRRADVYALGCVAYFLLTGELVFEGDTPMKVMMQHVQARPVPPSQRTELRIPPELDAIVLACLEKDPNRRPQHAEELLALACGCHSCEGWTQKQAREWWEKHLPEMTGPLTLEQPRAEARERSAMAL
jgi:tRNA A-37 threonylcarbamoyl transferase component Bud32